MFDGSSNLNVVSASGSGKLWVEITETTNFGNEQERVDFDGYDNDEPMSYHFEAFGAVAAYPNTEPINDYSGEFSATESVNSGKQDSYHVSAKIHTLKLIPRGGRIELFRDV